MSSRSRFRRLKTFPDQRLCNLVNPKRRTKIVFLWLWPMIPHIRPYYLPFRSTFLFFTAPDAAKTPSLNLPWLLFIGQYTSRIWLSDPASEYLLLNLLDLTHVKTVLPANTPTIPQWLSILRPVILSLAIPVDSNSQLSTISTASPPTWCTWSTARSVASSTSEKPNVL